MFRRGTALEVGQWNDFEARSRRAVTVVFFSREKAQFTLPLSPVQLLFLYYALS